MLPVGAERTAGVQAAGAQVDGIIACDSAIHRGFERQLATWQWRYAGRPEAEMLRLCLLALEREENVAVAYNETVLGRRLRGLGLPDNVAALMRDALRRVWKDEEWHTIYVRGLLRSLRRPLVSAHACFQQAAGALGGWTVAVRQHRRWVDAPVSRAAATLVTWAGELTGRVPPEVRRRLDYCSFRDFCRYNVETEGTAWLCWQRLTELAADVAELADGRVDDFRRITADEARHRQIFGILAEVLTDDDRLRAGVTEASLSARLSAIETGN